MVLLPNAAKCLRRLVSEWLVFVAVVLLCRFVVVALVVVVAVFVCVVVVVLFLGQFQNLAF